MSVPGNWLDVDVAISIDGVDEKEFARKLLAALANHLNSHLPRAVQPIKNRIGELIDRAIYNSPEAASLLGGQLQAELGVADPNTALRLIALAVATAIEVKVIPITVVSSNLSGGMSIGVLRTDLRDVLGLSVASFDSEGGYRIDWLEWLLTSGDNVILVDYAFRTAVGSRASRTRLGVMRRHGTWQVPYEYSGTVGDNWLSRAIATIGDGVVEILKDEVRKVL